MQRKVNEECSAVKYKGRIRMMLKRLFFINNFHVKDIIIQTADRIISYLFNRLKLFIHLLYEETVCFCKD